MKLWHAKQLGKLAKVSVRTLHYYDKINLLKPSVREHNNYRLYSEKDLLKLQQIIALKFFGFELSQIHVLLSTEEHALDNLSMQAKFLQEKANNLLEANAILKRILSECSDNKSIPWEQVIQLIEVYQMTQQLENSWVKEIFTADELKQYAQFEAEMKSNSNPEQKEIFEKSWSALVEEVKQNLTKDPRSDLGVRLGKKWMEFVNRLYGKKYAHLRTKKFENGFGEGKGLEQNGLSPEIIAWVEKAMDEYWHQRLYDVLAQVGTLSSAEVIHLWNEVMDDMYGEEEERKKAIPELALKDEKVGVAAKQWLKVNFNL